MKTLKTNSYFTLLLLYSIVFALTLTGCGSSQGMGRREKKEARQFIEAYRMIPRGSVTANGELVITNTSISSFFDDITLPIRYTKCEGQGVSLSVRPFGVLEAFRISVTDRELLIVDRLSRRYSHTSLSSLSTRIASSFVGINLHAPRALLSNDPFSAKGYGSDALYGLRFTYSPGRGVTFGNNTPLIRLSLSQDHELIESVYEFGSEDVKTSLRAKYEDFTSSDDVSSFPLKMIFNVGNNKGEVEFIINLGEVHPYTGDKITTTPPEGYHEVTLSEMRKIIASFSGSQ